MTCIYNADIKYDTYSDRSIFLSIIIIFFSSHIFTLFFTGVSLKHWEVLKPTDAELNQGLLTQLGGLAILSSTGDIKYQHIDQGICNVSSICVFTCIKICM
jgi:hypothetical protein